MPVISKVTVTVDNEDAQNTLEGLETCVSRVCELSGKHWEGVPAPGKASLC